MVKFLCLQPKFHLDMEERKSAGEQEVVGLHIEEEEVRDHLLYILLGN